MKTAINSLRLVYPPVSNQEAEWLKADSQVEAMLRRSNLYMIAQRREAKFIWDEANLWRDVGIAFSLEIPGRAKGEGFFSIESDLLQSESTIYEFGDKFVRVSRKGEGEELGEILWWYSTESHRRYQTPYISIVAFALVLWVLALMGTFRWNAALSSSSRLFIYGLTCAALPMLRKNFPGKEVFHLPGGLVFAVLGMVFTLALLSRMGLAELVTLTVTAAISCLNWLAVRGDTRSPNS